MHVREIEIRLAHEARMRVLEYGDHWPAERAALAEQWITELRDQLRAGILPEDGWFRRAVVELRAVLGVGSALDRIVCEQKARERKPPPMSGGQSGGASGLRL